MQTLSGKSFVVMLIHSHKMQIYLFVLSYDFLTADLDDKLPEKSAKAHNSAEAANCQLPFQTEHLSSVNGANALSMPLNKKHTESENVGMRNRKVEQHTGKNVGKEGNTLSHDNSGSDSDNIVQKMSYPSTIEKNEWKGGTLTGDGDQPKASQIPEAVGDLTLPTEVSFCYFSIK